ncbi:MAG TPA: ATP-binding cassette domain-containing protein, partial [Aliiroseovarius sp.]|nr:ATP-binding cassette domain-containing protein [Aliiroseovarius sp.]
AVARAEERRAHAAAGLDRTERWAGVALSMLGTLVAALALWLGAVMAQAGAISPAQAAIGFFAALALVETIAPLRRALSEQGRMVQAARRVVAMLQRAAPSSGADTPGTQLRIRAVSFRRANAQRPILRDFSLTLGPGETIALAGPSGSGKSTVLLMAAGLLAPDQGTITLGDTAIGSLSETALRQAVTLVQQRAALLQGSIADNLRIAAPHASDAELWDALRATHLAEVVEQKGGLEALLGPRGEGLSGGEARRLVLARAVLRQPRVLLLDEPTEGLHGALAQAVLEGRRAALPDAAILMAAHRPEEWAAADRVEQITPH